MDEIKNMTDYELAQRVQHYRYRLEALMSKVSDWLENRSGSRETILDEYKALKSEVKADAHYVGLTANSEGRATHYWAVTSAIREASAWGFTAPTNSSINQRLFSAIEEAHYKLGKCHPDDILEEYSSR